MIGLLTVVSGPDAGREFRIAEDHKTVWIGRGSKCQFVLTDPTASRRHGRFLKTKSKVLFTDGESKNGTKLNEARVEKSAYLNDGDRLTFGKTIVEFRSTEEGAAPAGPPDSAEQQPPASL
ncbi:MAG: FHA domain-containing protein [Planctomycetes bacterium]|nr:FHA domain-containing protein [Planctomycetota bacterium]